MQEEEVVPCTRASGFCPRLWVLPSALLPAARCTHAAPRSTAPHRASGPGLRQSALLTAAPRPAAA